MALGSAAPRLVGLLAARPAPAPRAPARAWPPPEEGPPPRGFPASGGRAGASARRAAARCAAAAGGALAPRRRPPGRAARGAGARWRGPGRPAAVLERPEAAAAADAAQAPEDAAAEERRLRDELKVLDRIVAGLAPVAASDAAVAAVLALKEAQREDVRKRLGALRARRAGRRAAERAAEDAAAAAWAAQVAQAPQGAAGSASPLPLGSEAAGSSGASDADRRDALLYTYGLEGLRGLSEAEFLAGMLLEMPGTACDIAALDSPLRCFFVDLAPGDVKRLIQGIVRKHSGAFVCRRKALVLKRGSGAAKEKLLRAAQPHRGDFGELASRIVRQQERRQRLAEDTRRRQMRDKFLLGKPHGTARSTAVLELLLRSAAAGDAAEYYDLVLRCLPKLDIQFTVEQYVRLLETLVWRLPVMENAIRLTLNLAILEGGVPLLAKDAKGGGSEVELLLAHGEERYDSTLESVLGLVRGKDAATCVYFSSFVVLLHLELLAELNAVEARLLLPDDQQDMIGHVMRDLRCDKLLAGGRCHILSLKPAGGTMPDHSSHRIVSGDTVMLSRVDPLVEGIVAFGEVNFTEHRVRVRLSRLSNIVVNDVSSGTWRIDKIAHWAIYDRMMQALRVVAEGRLRRGLIDLVANTSLRDEDPERGGGDVSEAEAAEVTEDVRGVVRLQPEQVRALAAEEAELPPEEAAVLQELRAVLPYTCPGEERLNESQRAALSAGLAGRLTLIQGPPGTGKTSVCVQLMRSWVKDLLLGPVLAVSHNNVAVDNLAEMADAIGLRVIRIGSPEKIGGPVQRLCMKREFEDVDVVDRCGEISRADVICCTNIKSGCAAIQQSGASFGAILMDEAAQATELSALVAIALCLANRVVLIGDPFQLPPTVSPEAARRGYSRSLFSRMVACGVQPHFLSEQFRMHPKIAEFSSQEFYGGRLHSSSLTGALGPPRGFPWPQPEAGVAFVDFAGADQRVGTSRRNPDEAALVLRLLTRLLAAGGVGASDIGVISPYAGQVRLLRRDAPREIGRRLAGLSCRRLGTAGPVEDVAAWVRQELAVETVDGFQGREREVIIVSTVRAQGAGVGFLADWRRLNVLLTRARRGLIVVGNASTLRAGPVWGRWLDWVEQQGFVAQLDGVNAELQARAGRRRHR